MEQNSTDAAAAKVAQQGIRRSQQLAKVSERPCFLWITLGVSDAMCSIHIIHMTEHGHLLTNGLQCDST